MNGPRARARERDEGDALEKQLERGAFAERDADATGPAPTRREGGSPGMGPGPATGVVEPRDPLATAPQQEEEGQEQEEEGEDEEQDEDDDVPSVPELPSPEGDDA